MSNVDREPDGTGASAGAAGLLMKLSTALTMAGVGLTVLIWGWALTRPPDTYRDQGGLVFLCLYVPLTGLVWAGCGLAALLTGVFGICRSRSRLRAKTKVMMALAMALAAAMALLGLGISWQYGSDLPSLLWYVLAAQDSPG